jgi:hypothetical protein
MSTALRGCGRRGQVEPKQDSDPKPLRLSGNLTGADSDALVQGRDQGIGHHLRYVVAAVESVD